MMFIMRNRLLLILVVILSISCLPMIAFADDEPGDSSPGDRYATEEEIQVLYSAISETSHNLALLMASGDSVKATDYEQATYNLLSSVFGSSSTSWASIVATRLGYLSTINSSANSLVVKLTSFYNSINPDYDTTGISMYDVVHGLLTSLTTIDPDDGDLTIIETLVYIHTKLEDLDTSLSAILNSTYSIDAKIVNLHNFLINFRTDINTGFSTIDTSINTGFTNVNANMQLIINRLQTFNQDFNNINWSTLNNVTFTLSQSNGDPVSSGSVYINPIIDINSISSFNSNFSLPTIVELKVPIRLTNGYSSNLLNIQLYYLQGNQWVLSTDNLVEVYYKANPGSTTIYLVLHRFNRYKIEFLGNYYFHGTTVVSRFLNSDSIDYYYVYSNLLQFEQNSILKKFESLYASDDLIAAKQDQQVYEDQAIEDFTGSGSAAASGSDLTDMKSISGAIKSGLQSGGSVNNALAPFNTNSGFWGWFSQSNYDNINNIPVTRLRSGNNNEPEIIDFYSNNQFTLQGLLNGGGN